MHIAFLTPEYPHPELSRSGGLGTSIKNLAKGLISKDVRVTVFVIAQSLDIKIDDEGIILISVAKKKHHVLNWYFERKRFQSIIQDYTISNKVDLIEAPDWTGLSAFMKFSVPLIIRLNGSDGYFCHLETRKQKWKHYFLEKKALKKADAIVSVSAFTGKITKQIFGIKEHIEIIHNSINIDDFKPIETEIKKGQLLYFGTIIRKKGILELAKVLNLVVKERPDVQFVMIGKDALDIFDKASTIALFYKLLNKEAKSVVTYLNEVPYQDIKQFIAESQVVVLPSFAEAFPMTWLETLAMEKPLISSNVGWANELMKDGVTGYTVNPKDHNMFSEKIISLLGDAQLCHNFGIAGRKHVIDHFSTEIITLKNIEFYKDCIAS